MNVVAVTPPCHGAGASAFRSLVAYRRPSSAVKRSSESPQATGEHPDNNCPRRRISWPIVASAPARYRSPIIGCGGIFDTVIGTTREDARFPRRAFGHVVFAGKKENVMSAYVWQCKKCAHNIERDSRPNDLNCPKGGQHQWCRLGEVGPVDYLCDKCGTQVQTKSRPSDLDCPAGSQHHWTKM